ncbi:MAG: hypothetical protein AB1461_20090 [Thermodesulfobacteriota bacterium]
MMNSENSLADNKEQASGALVTLDIFLKFFAVLYVPSVLAGRWYKQWYYAAFGISFEELELTQFEYVMSSWTSWLSAFALVFIVWNLYASCKHKGAAAICVALTVVLIALLLALFWPFPFDPQGSLLVRVLGSRDIIWWLLGLVSLLALDRLAHHGGSSAGITHDNIITELVDRVRLLLADFKSFAVLLLVTVGLLLVSGYGQAIYQAHAAISEGKMGLRNSVYQGREWHRLNIGSRVYLFDPAGRTTIQYKDDAALPARPFRKLLQPSSL